MAKEVTKLEKDPDAARAEMDQTRERISQKAGTQLIRAEKIRRVNPLVCFALS